LVWQCVSVYAAADIDVAVCICVCSSIYWCGSMYLCMQQQILMWQCVSVYAASDIGVAVVANSAFLQKHISMFVFRWIYLEIYICVCFLADIGRNIYLCLFLGRYTYF
jgi:hypothetical protein